MIIGVDGNEANIKNRVGVNQYAFEVLKGIYDLKTAKKHRFIIYLREKPLAYMPPEKKGWEYKILPSRKLWIITRLMPHLYTTKLRPDVIFSPSHYTPPFSPVPRVCSIMDLKYLESSGHLKMYDYWQLRLWSAWSIFVSKYVISISNTTKKDILDHYKFAKGKVKVTLLGYDSKRFNPNISKSETSRIRQKYAIKNYILFLGTLKPSKNVEGLLKAWAKTDSRKTHKLVIAGKKGWLYDSIFSTAKSLGIENRVVFTGFINEKDKPPLVVGSKCFVMPSFTEGFGIDALTAMGSGVPVIVSDQGSLPEVVGNAGIMVDPYDIAGMAAEIEKVLNMGKKEYNELVKKGLRQASKFSWKKTAEETLSILESVK